MSLENLPANIDTLDTAALMRMTGQTMSGQSGVGVPSLRVNYDDEDQDGNEIPRGSWTVYTDKGQVFAKSVMFRIMLATIQYNHYDADEQKNVSTSVHVQGFDGEIPDSIGGFKCGKVSKKQLAELSEAEQKVQKSIKCAKVLFGLVSLSGTNTKGEEVEINNLPCVFYARGTHFMPMSDYIADLERHNTPMLTVTINLDLDRKKNGGVTFWEVNPSTEEKDVPVTKDDHTVYEAFVQTVKAENDEIMAKWKASRAVEGEKAMKNIATAVSTPNDLNDDISDIIDGQSEELNILQAG